ncbi:MAG: small multi-drug export protein [Peptoniphilus sp.]|nr:small multi-drug export protein [Peptoniphilus sp.]
MDFITTELSKYLSRELVVLIIAMMPFVELKLALPVGLSLGMGVPESFIYSYLGSLVPMPFIIFFIRNIFSFLKSRRFLKSAITKIVEKSHLKYENLIKYKKFGLFLFVAIPLPGTGVWSASLIANLVNLDKISSVIAISFGNLIAGIIILSLSGLVIL